MARTLTKQKASRKIQRPPVSNIVPYEEKVIIKYNQKSNVFYLTTNNFNAGKIRGVASTRQDGATLYYFSATYPDGIFSLKDAKAIFPNCKVSKAAGKKVEYLKKVPQLIPDLALLEKYNPAFKVTPYQHQLRAIEMMLHYDRLAILAEQGLGKTFISLNHFCIEQQRTYKKGIKGLVFAPKIVLSNWVEETSKHTNLRIVRYSGTEEKRKRLREYLVNNQDKWDLIVTNYECVSNTSTKIKSYEYIKKGEVVVGDRALLQDTDGSETQNWLKIEKIRKKGRSTYYTLEKVGEVKSPEVRRLLRKFDDGKSTNLDFDLFRKELDFEVVYMDEGSRLKGFRSTRSQSVRALVDSIPKRYILSGTITLGNPLDVYMPFTILNEHIFPDNYWRFRKKHCHFSSYNKHQVTGYKNLDSLKAHIDPYIVSFTRDECIDLPDRIFLERYFELTEEQRQIYNDIIKEEEVEVGDTVINVKLPVVKINKLLQVLSGFIILPPERDDSVCNHCNALLDCVDKHVYPWNKDCIHYGTEKVSHIKKPARKYYSFPGNEKPSLLMEDIKDIDGQVIIWVYYKKELEDIQAALKKEGITYILASEEDCDKKFTENPKIKVFLGQISQGIGITLNTAKDMKYYSQSLSLEDRLQSMDRNYRIGQDSKVSVTDYLCRGSLLEPIIGLLRKKCDVKDFLQTRVECAACDQAEYCLECDIRPYSEDCILFAIRNSAEQKSVIQLKPIRRRRYD